MQNIHQEILNNIDSNLIIKERLMGGMSNYTYLVTDGTNKFVFRVPGEGAANFVDNFIEEKNMEKIKSLEINSTTTFLEPINGYKIAKYIEGSMLKDDCNLEDVTSTLKKLHTSGFLFDNNYNHLERLASYESIHTNDSEEYKNLKSSFNLIFDTVLKQHIDTPCHNDAQVANFIEEDGGRIYLLDWEFAGNNDHIYDIASFGNKDFNRAIDLLNVYHPNPSNDLYARLYAWRMFQCLQWFNVASYKEETGMSEKLGVDFKFVAGNYLKLAKSMYDEYLKY